MLRVPRQETALAAPSAPPGEFERWRRDHFIVLRFALTLPFMALAPLFLLLRGAPGAWDAAAFAVLLAPLIGVYVLHRHDRFDAAQAVCSAAILALGVVLTLANGAVTMGAIACFLLGLLEATLGGASRLALGGAAGSILIMAASIAATALGLLRPPAGADAVDLAIVLSVTVYGALLTIWAARMGEKRERDLSASVAAYRELAETIGDLVIHFDRTGAVIDLDGARSQVLGGRRGDLIGRGLFERIQVADRPAFLKAIADAAANGRVVDLEFRLRANPDSEAGDASFAPIFKWVDMRARRSCAAAGMVVAVLRDANASREAREATERARAASEQSTVWKDRFLANVSHELRTPLNAIIGFSEMLANPAMARMDDARQREYAGIIHESGNHLLSLVNTILDMSKIETGNFEIAPEHFDLAGLIDFCCDVVKLKADEKQIALTRSSAPHIGEIVADKRACKQILLNILSNALKFTPEGGSVSVAARPDGAFVEIAVSDSGIGVAQADLGRLGDPFFQAKATYDRPYEGAGLGLSIVRGLVGLHGGALSFESAPNQGACVTVRLPLDCRTARMSANNSMKIETLARRGRPIAMLDPARPNDQVKKIA